MSRRLTPIRWMGGKQTQMAQLRKSLPCHFTNIIEAFAGSAALSLALLADGQIDGSQVCLNDTNISLVAFFISLRDRSHDLADGILNERHQHGLGSRNLYEVAKSTLMGKHGTALKRAIMFYVHNTLITVARQGGNNNYSHPLKSGRGLRKERIFELSDYAKLLQNVKISCKDYRGLEIGSVSDLQYLDPPFKKVGRNRIKDYYDCEFNHSRFLKWCQRIKSRTQICISYDDNPEHIRNFRKWNIYRVPVYYHSRHVWDTELIITNYKIPFSDLWVEESGWEIIKEDGVYFPHGRRLNGADLPVATEPVAANDNTSSLPNKTYEIIYADPPWPYYGSQTKMGAAGNHYKTMPLEEIKALDVQSVSAKDSVCFMWATASSMHDVKDVMKAWGFNLNPNHFVWRKTRKDGVPMGTSGVRPSYVKSANTEYLFIGSTRKNGKAPWVGVSNAGAALVQMVEAPRLAHSQKPERFRELIMELTGDRTRIELFARRGANDEWDVWGNQAVSE